MWGFLHHRNWQLQPATGPDTILVTASPFLNTFKEGLIGSQCVLGVVSRPQTPPQALASFPSCRLLNHAHFLGVPSAAVILGSQVLDCIFSNHLLFCPSHSRCGLTKILGSWDCTFSLAYVLFSDDHCQLC